MGIDSLGQIRKMNDPKVGLVVDLTFPGGQAFSG